MQKLLELIGYTADLEKEHKFAYVIAAIGSFQLMTFLAFYMYVIQVPLLTVQTIVVLIAYLSTFYYFKKKHYVVGKAIIILGITIQVTLLVFVWFPKETHFVYYFFIVPPGSFFIFDFEIKKERNYLIVLNALITILLVASEMIAPMECIYLEDHYIHFLSILTVISTICIEILVFYFYASNLSRTHKELKLLANTDALTNISNRRVLFEQGEALFHICHKYNKSFALMILDIDYFKKINDQYGHPAGDEVLKELTQLISNHIRKEDLFCRYGGEEFAVLLKNVHGEYQNIIETLKHLIEEHAFQVNEDTFVELTVSIGVVACKERFRSFDELVNKADAMLYQAKETGRNKIVYYKEQAV